MVSPLIATPGAESVAGVIGLFGLLIALAIGLITGVVLIMRMLRHRHEPAKPRKPATERDPWLEAGRRLDVEDE